MPVTISKKIVLKVKEDQTTVLPGLDLSDVRFKVSSGYDASGKVLRPLSYEEEKKYLPEIVGVSITSPDWEKQVLDYWKNIVIRVPYPEGKELEIGMTYPSKDDAEKEKNGSPINVVDYLAYRFCLVKNSVANNYEDMYKSSKIKHYLFSKELESKAKQDILKLKELSFEAYFSIKSDEQAINDMLILFDIDYSEMLLSDKKIKLNELSEQFPSKFIERAKDKTRKLKAFINRAVSNKVVRQLPNTETYVYEDTTLGSSMDEVVAYLKSENPDRQRILNNIKATLISRLSSKGETYVFDKTEPVKEKEPNPTATTANK